MSTAVTTLRFNGSQHFRMSLAGVSRDHSTTYNVSLRFRTRQSACHLMTLTSSLDGVRLRLFVDGGRVKLRVPTLVRPHRSSTSYPASRSSSVVSREEFFPLLFYATGVCGHAALRDTLRI